jgi:hypothetical protein
LHPISSSKETAVGLQNRLIILTIAAWTPLAAHATGEPALPFTLSAPRARAAGIGTAGVRPGARRPPVAHDTHEIVADGSFEGGSPSSAWTESSAVFGTPLSQATLGTAGGSGTHTGDWLAWFGGTGFGSETAMLSQTLVMPKGAGRLTFWTEAPICGSAADLFQAQIDGTTVFQMTGTDATCGEQTYIQRSALLSTWADGGSHTLTFTSQVTGAPASNLLSVTTSNFLLDDVSIEAATSIAAVPTLSSHGLAGLALLVAAAAVIILRLRGRSISFRVTPRAWVGSTDREGPGEHLVVQCGAPVAPPLHLALVAACAVVAPPGTVIELC